MEDAPRHQRARGGGNWTSRWVDKGGWKRARRDWLKEKHKLVVPLYRKRVFAEIKPVTQTRVDFGLALGNMKASGRLIDSAGFAKKDRITHRVPIIRLEEIGDEVKHWLKTAYEMDA